MTSRGWVDPVPDPLLLRKSGSAGNRTRDLCICSQKLWPLDHRGGRNKRITCIKWKNFASSWSFAKWIVNITFCLQSIFHNELKERHTTVLLLFKEDIREGFESKFNKIGFNPQNNSWNFECKNRQGLLRTPCIGNLKGGQRSGHYTQHLTWSVQCPVWEYPRIGFQFGAMTEISLFFLSIQI